MLSTLILSLGKIKAARKLHGALLENKFHTPQAFYDTTPLGRVINRFSKDIYVIDEALPSTVLMFLGTSFSSLSVMIVIIFSTPIFAVVIVPLALIYFFVQVTKKHTRRGRTGNQKKRRREKKFRVPIWCCAGSFFDSFCFFFAV